MNTTKIEDPEKYRQEEIEERIGIRDILYSFWDNKFLIILILITSAASLLYTYTFLIGTFGNSLHLTTFEIVEFAPSNSSHFYNGEPASVSIIAVESIYESMDDVQISREDFDEFILEDYLMVGVDHSYIAKDNLNVYTYMVALQIKDIMDDYSYSEKVLKDFAEELSNGVASFIYKERFPKQLDRILSDAYNTTESNIERLALLEYSLTTLEEKYTFYLANYTAYKSYAEDYDDGEYLNDIEYANFVNVGQLVKYYEERAIALYQLKTEVYAELLLLRSSYDFGATTADEFAAKIDESLTNAKLRALTINNAEIAKFNQLYMSYLENMKIDLIVSMETGLPYSAYSENTYDDMNTNTITVAYDFRQLRDILVGVDRTKSVSVEGDYYNILSASTVYIVIGAVSLILAGGYALMNAKKTSVVIVYYD